MLLLHGPLWDHPRPRNGQTLTYCVSSGEGYRDVRRQQPGVDSQLCSQSPWVPGASCILSSGPQGSPFPTNSQESPFKQAMGNLQASLLLTFL